MSLQFDIQQPRRDFTLDLKGNFGVGTVGIFGPSGAGKSSLFSLLAGLEKPLSGKIVLDGEALFDSEKNIFVPPHRRRIGVVFQEKLLFPHLSVKENLLFGTPYAHEGNLSCEEVAELLNLTSLLSSLPAEISGGEQQRVAIGRALLTSPRLLLMDEPFNAVDNELRLSILPYLKMIGREMDIPLLVISHDLPDIQRLTDQIYLVNRGRCLGSGNIYDVLETCPSVDNLDLVNTFELCSPLLKEDLYESHLKENEELIIKSSEALPGEFTLTVAPDEVSLSKSYIDQISIQNQLPGTILKRISMDKGYIFIVDCGVRIAAKVSAHGADEMNLHPGDRVFCLFKAHSLSS